nr:zinc finger, CCHC-type [Tanacetum cinerariifolium]
MRAMELEKNVRHEELSFLKKDVDLAIEDVGQKQLHDTILEKYRGSYLRLLSSLEEQGHQCLTRRVRLSGTRLKGTSQRTRTVEERRMILRSCEIHLNPSTWLRILQDFKHTLKHGKDDLSLVQLGSHLRIEKSLRAQDSGKGKGKEVGGSSVNMTEEGSKNKHHKQNKSKKRSNENNSGIAEVVKRTTQMLVVRERGLKTNLKTNFDAIAWWIDFGATTHVCKDRCWSKTYEPMEDGSVTYMGDDHFAPVHGKRSVALEFISRKTITLFNVLYVPKLRKNLVSGPMLNKCGYKQKKAKLFKEWEMFTSTDGESSESYYHRFSKLMNDFKKNKPFPEKIASNLKFLNNLQSEWSRHVTIVHQTKDLHTTDYTHLYDLLKYNQKENPEDSSDHTIVMNMALALLAKAFKVNTIPTNNNQRSSLISLIVQNLGIHIVKNMNGLSVVPEITNQYGNGNVVTTSDEGNGNGINGNPIRCYNCQGDDHYASNCTVKSRKRDASYLHQQLQIAQEKEAGIQSTQEEFEFMTTADAHEETERVKVNCTSEDTLQQSCIQYAYSRSAVY